MLRHVLPLPCALTVLFGCVSGPAAVDSAEAVSSPRITAALKTLRSGDAQGAAALFCAIESASAGEEHADAEWGLVQSLSGFGYPIAAQSIALGVLDANAAHRHFGNAFSWVAEAAAPIDDLVVAGVALDRAYNNQNLRVIVRIRPDSLWAAHYVIALRALKKGHLKEAREFLKTVPSTSPLRAKADLADAENKAGRGQVFAETLTASVHAKGLDSLSYERAALAKAPPASTCVAERISQEHESYARRLAGTE